MIDRIQLTPLSQFETRRPCSSLLPDDQPHMPAATTARRVASWSAAGVSTRPWHDGLGDPVPRRCLGHMLSRYWQARTLVLVEALADRERPRRRCNPFLDLLDLASQLVAFIQSSHGGAARLAGADNLCRPTPSCIPSHGAARSRQHDNRRGARAFPRGGAIVAAHAASPVLMLDV